MDLQDGRYFSCIGYTLVYIPAEEIKIAPNIAAAYIYDILIISVYFSPNLPLDGYL